MTCEEAARVLDAFSVPNDKLLALQSLKRALKDAESPEGQAAILASIPYEPDRMVALQILSTVCMYFSIHQSNIETCDAYTYTNSSQYRKTQ